MLHRSFAGIRGALPILLLLLSLAFENGLRAEDVVVDGLQRPSKIIRTPLGNLLVAEVGTAAAAPNTGRVSIIDPDGNRRTLLDGLPSAPSNAARTPSGPSGLYLWGRTLLVVIGEGDVTLAGPIPRTEIANPAPASPIFSSVLAVHFSARAETMTTGIALSREDHDALHAGEQLVRSDAAGEKITINLIVNFPDYVSEPLAALPANVRHSHPYGIVADEEFFLYVVDGGYNVVHKVDVLSGDSVTLVRFPTSPNPLFGIIGPPRVENVPTSIRWHGNRLLVTLLSGFPFNSGLSEIHEIDPVSGDNAVLIDGLTSAIDVIPLTDDDETTGFLTLEYSLAHLAGGPGRLQIFNASATPVEVLSNELITPASMVYDQKSGSVIIAEINLNRLISIPLQ